MGESDQDLLAGIAGLLYTEGSEQSGTNEGNVAQMVCPWCRSDNPTGSEACLACGGPLMHQQGSEPGTGGEISGPEFNPGARFTPIGEAQEWVQSGETGDSRDAGARRTYPLIWRTLADAAAISVSGFLLGLIGEVSGPGWAGMVGGAAIGAAVSLSSRNIPLTMLGAPLGTLFGAGLWLVARASGAGWGGMVWSALLLGVLGTLPGGHRPVIHGSCLMKLRPFLGAAAGIFWAGLGVWFSWGLRQLVINLLQTIPGG